ncbi:MAG TPA: SCO family protein [Verrucomicrobiae bacterium]|nr:SCO family protein [Verrucomicrobiae bacterium]
MKLAPRVQGGAESRGSRPNRRRVPPDAEARQALEVLPMLILSRLELSRTIALLTVTLAVLAIVAGAVAWAQPAEQASQTYEARGRVVEIHAAEGIAVIAHEAISNLMPAMTMPFHVRPAAELLRLNPGDKVVFELNVTKSASWAEHIVKNGRVLPTSTVEADAGKRADPPARPRHPLLDYPFTNELGQVVRLADFRGQALGLTFFFTRCPLPEFCPRLSLNFAEAEKKLEAMGHVPGNWHFVSVSFDPEFDTPGVLKAYGEHYGYDPRHWSFLTGRADKIHELAELSDVSVQRQADGSIAHNFRTLVINPAGHLQMMFPMGGDLSDALVAEMLKAMTMTNRDR